MLHGKKKRTNDHVEDSQEMIIEIEIKQEPSDDQTCRICLKDGKLPIFVDNATELRESIYQIGGVEVCADDPYPKYLCQSCHALLRGAMLFRKTAQTSDNLLKKQNAAVKPEPTSVKDDHSDVDDIPVPRKKRTVKPPKPRVCKRCDLQFSTTQEYRDHLLSSEHEKKRITCNICKNSYCCRYYKRHFCLRKPTIPDICDICGKKFTVKSVFVRHRLIHSYDLPHQCALCPYRGRSSGALKMHMRTHTGEKPYGCEQCPSRFMSKSNLNKHTLTHKDKHFRCEVCSRGFYVKRELELHIQVDHTDIREHVCRICGKAFGYRKLMMKHERGVHKREKLKSGRMPIYLQVETMKLQNAVAADKKQSDVSKMLAENTLLQ